MMFILSSCKGTKSESKETNTGPASKARRGSGHTFKIGLLRHHQNKADHSNNFPVIYSHQISL